MVLTVAYEVKCNRTLVPYTLPVGSCPRAHHPECDLGMRIRKIKKWHLGLCVHLDQNNFGVFIFMTVSIELALTPTPCLVLSAVTLWLSAPVWLTFHSVFHIYDFHSSNKSFSFSLLSESHPPKELLYFHMCSPYHAVLHSAMYSNSGTQPGMINLLPVFSHLFIYNWLSDFKVHTMSQQH